MDDVSAWGWVATIIGLTAAFLFGTPFGIALWRTRLADRLQPVKGQLDVIRVGPAGEPGPKGPYYAIDGSYRYAVAGRDFTGDRVGLEFNLYESESAARAVLGGVETGQPVTVWYDPSKPGRAVLDNAPPQGLWFYLSGLVAGAVIALGGIIAVLVAG